MFDSPTNIEEAVEKLTKRDVEGIEEWKYMKEEDAIYYAYFGLGMNIRQEWDLWFEDSELGQYFRKEGVEDAGAMSEVILRVWHRTLNQKELNIETLLEENKTN